MAPLPGNYNGSFVPVDENNEPLGTTGNPIHTTGGGGGGGGAIDVTGVTYTDAANLDIDTGGASQEVFAANASRTGLIIQNNSDADLWVGIGQTATAAPPSIRLIGGGLGILQFPDSAGRLPKGQISIIGATAGQAFSAKEAEDA